MYLRCVCVRVRAFILSLFLSCALLSLLRFILRIDGCALPAFLSAVSRRPVCSVPKFALVASCVALSPQRLLYLGPDVSSASLALVARLGIVVFAMLSVSKSALFFSSSPVDFLLVFQRAQCLFPPPVLLAASACYAPVLSGFRVPSDVSVFPFIYWISCSFLPQLVRLSS